MLVRSLSRFASRTALTSLTASVMLCAVAQAQVNSFEIFKQQNFVQNSAAAPVTPVSYNGYARILTGDPATVTAASVFKPDSTVVNLPEVTPTFYQAQFGTYATKAELDAALPAGNYAFSVTGGTAAGQAAAVTLPGDQYPLNLPFVTNWVTLQSFNAAAGGSIDWNGYTSSVGANNPLIFYGIYDHTSGNLIFGGSASNLSTSAFIPANTPAAGTTYDVSVVYSDRFEIQNAGFNGALSGADYEYIVNTSLVTTPAASAPEPGSLGLALSGMGMGTFLLRKRRNRR